MKKENGDMISSFALLSKDYKYTLPISFTTSPTRILGVVVENMPLNFSPCFTLVFLSKNHQVGRKYIDRNHHELNFIYTPNYKITANLYLFQEQIHH